MPTQGSENLSWEPFFQKISKALATSQLNYFAGPLCDTPRKKVLLLLLPLVQVFIAVTCVVGMLTPNKYDVDDKILCLIIFLTEYNVVMKLSTIIYNNSLLRNLNGMIVTYTSRRFLEPWEQALAKKYHRTARWICIKIFVLYFLTMSSFIVLPMFSEKSYMMPILMEVAGTNQSSHPGYEINYLLGAYSVYYGTTIQLGFDIPAFLQACFIAFQLDKCTHYCQLIGDFDSEYNTNEKQSQLIVKCIKFHENILKFTRKVGSINTAVVLTFLTTFPLLTLGLYSLLSGTLGSGPIIMIASSYHVFVYCFLGEVVSTKFREVSEAIYNSQWNNIQRVEDKRTFLLFLTLSQRDVYFSIGGLYRLSLETFTETMKRVYGACAFLKEVI